MATGKRARDYRAEEAARNAKARQMGFSSRAQMRRALRQGWQPVRRGRSGRGPIMAPPPDEPAPPIAQGLRGLGRIRAESQAWSRRHSRKLTSRYRSTFTAAELRAYHNAYVNDATKAIKIENELYSLREFLVDTMGFYTDEGFDDRYGVTHTREVMAQYANVRILGA